MNGKLGNKKKRCGTIVSHGARPSVWTTSDTLIHAPVHYAVYSNMVWLLVQADFIFEETAVAAVALVQKKKIYCLIICAVLRIKMANLSIFYLVTHFELSLCIVSCRDLRFGSRLSNRVALTCIATFGG